MKILLWVVEGDIPLNPNFTFCWLWIWEPSEWTNLSFSFVCSCGRASRINFHTCVSEGWVIAHGHSNYIYVNLPSYCSLTLTPISNSLTKFYYFSPPPNWWLVLPSEWLFLSVFLLAIDFQRVAPSKFY